jgi:tetratricopeptide (TPR) repeat protein
MRRLLCLVLVLSLPIAGFAATKKKDKKAKAAEPVVSTTLPVTTKSLAARKAFEQGVTDYENLKVPESLDEWRKATKLDPDFALAYAFLSRVSGDPAEKAGSIAKAKASAAKVTPGEQLLVRWYGATLDNDYISAIAAMNDLLAQFPKDKRVRLYASMWFLTHGTYERSLELAEQALVLDPDYPAALNEAGYACAYLGQMDKAFGIMEKYISLLPKEANPQDSFAEFLRLDGKFPQALDHYRAALRVDPKFDSSQLGIADTLNLMGEYDRAREEYAKAAQMASDEPTRLSYLSHAPVSYVREGKYDEADKAFEEVLSKIHAAGMGALESAVLRDMALYQKDDATSFALLDRAEKALAEHEVSAGDREGELAYILRDRVIRAAASRNKEAKTAALDRLKLMAENSRRDDVQQAFHLAMGASLISEKKNGEAIEHLYENASNPRALQLLATAFQNMKASSEAASVRQKLARLHEPTMENAIANAALRGTERAN